MKIVLETLVQIARLIELFMDSQNKPEKAPEPRKQIRKVK
jgi:hypothetical protein